MDYWKESLESAAEECGLVMTDEQLTFMADAMRGSHENYGLYTGHDSIPCPAESRAKKELEELKRDIDQEKAWICSTDPCRRCSTSGAVLDIYSRNQTCPECGGKGRVSKRW